MKRIAPIRVISFLLLVAGGALCQSDRRSTDSHQWDGSNSPEVQREEMRTWRSFPDTPSTVQPPKQAAKFQTLVDEARSPLAPGAVGTNPGVRRGTELRHVASRPEPGFAAPYEAVITQEKSNYFVGKYFYPSSLKQKLLYHPSTSSSFMGRATYAASNIFVTHDDSGKKRLNTSYFLGVLSSVAIRSAYRPYWTRSPAASFNDFGSTIGNEARINLFHEFGPGIRLMVKGHAPKFVFKIDQRITRDQHTREVVPNSAR